MKELNHVLEAEKSCRTDLEMYVAVLNTQKSVLQEDAEKLRKELHDGTFFYTSHTLPTGLYLVFGVGFLTLDLGSGMLEALCVSSSVCHKLELERQQHNQLKHTWQRANDQFLESQRLLMRDMQRIESVLSSEQLRQVEVIKKRDQVARVHTHAHTVHSCHGAMDWLVLNPLSAAPLPCSPA